MGDRIITAFVTIGTAIVGIAIIAVLVSKNAQTGQVIQAGTSGFAQDISAAVAPVTGSGGFGNLGISNGFTGGGGGAFPSLQ
jgi:hypothetical protein